MGNGINHVRYVENINYARKNIGISQEDGFRVGNVRNALYNILFQFVRFLLAKAGNAKITQPRKSIFSTILKIMDYIVDSIARNLTYEWLKYKHYAHRIPSITYSFGLFDVNRHFIGYEIAKEYYDIACERIKQEQAQLTLF